MLSAKNLANTITFVEEKSKQLISDIPFEYRFLDDDYEKLYRSELQLGTMMNLFSGIAIVLACLDLFGLSSYVAQQSTKEIGIRKVLGASLFSLVRPLSGNSAKLVLISIVVATPFAYLSMLNWPSDFAYRIEIQWWIFVLTGCGALAITLLTVGSRQSKTALMNPVKSLRSE
jgi:putative ABC transport system permease protein